MYLKYILDVDSRALGDELEVPFTVTTRTGKKQLLQKKI